MHDLRKKFLCFVVGLSCFCLASKPVKAPGSPAPKGLAVSIEERRRNRLLEHETRLKQASAPAIRVLKVLKGFQVTWYNYNSGKTATGTKPIDGVTIAVDPKVIPYGTWVEIEFPSGKKLTRRAEDCGGAVKGKIIDIYSTKSTKTLLKRGRVHNVIVRILGDGGR